MNEVQKSAAGERVLNPEQEKIAAGVKRHARSKLPVFLRAWTGVASKRDAIRAKCLDCSGLSVTEVRHCTVTTCGLWLYRPYQKKG